VFTLIWSLFWGTEFKQTKLRQPLETVQFTSGALLRVLSSFGVFTLFIDRLLAQAVVIQIVDPKTVPLKTVIYKRS
jgi:hypothetical protein